MKPLALCLLSLLFVSAGTTESPVVSGQVRLPDGQPVVGAQVVLFDVADLRRGVLVRTTTDAAGEFAMPLVALGRSARPEGFVLGHNYPNPFNPATVIPYELAASAHVRLEVFNLLGQRIAMLMDGYQAAGAHTAVWTATDAAGQAVAAGVYLYRLTVGGVQQTGRMVLVDGQAGVAAAAGPGRQTVVGATDGGERSYGLAVLGAGLVPYVDAAFALESGPVEVVIEEGALQPRGKGLATADDELDDLFALLDTFTSSESQAGSDGDGAAEADSSEAAVADLVVDSLWVDASDLSPSEQFVLWVRLRNQGAAAADSTMVGFYLSNNSTISTSDTQMGSVPVGGLAAADTSTVSLELTAPSRLATHWVGACVEAVGGEQDAENNCSAAVEITVSPVVPRADLVVAATVSTEAPGRGNNIFPQGLSFTLSAMVSNQGTAASDSTMVYYYVSADSTIGSDDAELGMEAVGGLAVADTSAHSLQLSAPSEAGTYYYGACAASVAGESETDNNCSSGVRVIVYEQPAVASAATPATPATSGSSTTGDNLQFVQALSSGSVAIDFVWIGPGTFQMGASDSDKACTDDNDNPKYCESERPQHEVQISKGFWLGKYEVTQGQWQSVMGTTPWSGNNKQYVQSNSSHPAVWITYNEVQSFIQKLNTAAGSAVYRLPTEAEWEYACRAGTTTRWSFGDDESQLTNYAWYSANAWNANEQYAHAVGTKGANPWGLYDMHGNVQEWVQDWYGRDYYNSSPRVDPKGPSSGIERVVRGGTVFHEAKISRSASRFKENIERSFNGFRLLKKGS